MNQQRAAKEFTRAELYDLVWSKPRTALAKEVGVSDVAVTKCCKLACIPTPGVGHWSKLAAGRKSVPIPLPSRLPGQANTVLIGGGPHALRWPAAGDLIAEPESPTFAEDIEQQVADVVRRIGRVSASRDLTTPDRALAKVLEAEAKRRAKSESDTYSWHKPRFDQSVFQRHLKLFNSLARALRPVYGVQSVSEGDEWFQGRGTHYHVVLHLRFGGAGMYVRMHEPGELCRERGLAPVKVATLRVEPGGHEEPLLRWTDLPGRKLESQLEEIVGAVVRRAEERLRTQERWRYEQQCKRRTEALEALERQRIETEQERAQAVAARKARARDEVIELAKRRRTAEDIRAAVASLRLHPDVETSEGRALFEAWAASALEAANDLDPMRRPLREVLRFLPESA